MIQRRSDECYRVAGCIYAHTQTELIVRVTLYKLSHMAGGMATGWVTKYNIIDANAMTVFVACMEANRTETHRYKL